MKNKLKYAVVGVGNMGKNHARTCSEISQLKLVAVVDSNEQVGMGIASQYNCNYYRDYLEMLDMENPDAISICVPTNLHFSVASQAINHKIHVLLEKPISSSISEGEALLKLANENNVKFLVGHIERFNPAVKKVKDIVKKGDLGKIIAVIARRVGGFPPQIRDANIAVDLAIHDIDIINYLLDDLPNEVYVNKQKNHIKQREDSVEFFLKYKNSSAYVQSNWVTPVKIRKLNITGSEGYLEMDYVSQRIRFYKSNYDKFKEESGGFSDYILRFSEPDIIDIPVVKKEPLKEEILYFLDCISNNVKIESQFALDALKISLTK